MINKNQKMNKFDAHAIELKAAVEAERQAEARHVEAETTLSALNARLNKGDDNVTPTAYVEAKAAVEMAEMIAKARAKAVKTLRANTPWDPILADELAIILREAFAGLNVVVMDRHPNEFKVDVPTAVVYQSHRARQDSVPGRYTGDVRVQVFAPDYMGSMFALDREQVRKALENSRRARFRVDDVSSNAREIAVQALAVWDALPKVGRIPTDADAVSAAESIGRAILKSSELAGRTEVAHINYNRHVIPLSTIKAKPFGGKIVGSKSAAGKRVATAEAYLDAWPHPDLEGMSPDAARRAVEREADALLGSVLAGLGRVTAAEVRQGKVEGQEAELYKVTITAEAAA